jgi:hypothetical protein
MVYLGLGSDVFKIRIKLENARTSDGGATGFGFKMTMNLPIVTLGRTLTTLVSAVFMRLSQCEPIVSWGWAARADKVSKRQSPTWQATRTSRKIFVFALS